jgi:methyl-accepting chemotaxis protein
MPTSPATELKHYRAYVRKRLSGLNQIFAKASVGDFSERLSIPSQDDEFSELYAGIEIMLEVIQEKISELERLNKELTWKIHELERINRLMVGRELRMRELKQALADVRAKIKADRQRQP